MRQLYQTLKGWAPDAPKASVNRRLNDARHYLRAYFGCLPDFIILGTQKGGTTSLYNYLVQHPCIHTAGKKEIGYFNNRFEHTLQWYRAHFPTRLTRFHHRNLKKQPFITGEADPAYIFDPYALSAIHRLVPEARLILLLRDPVERAWSHYRHTQRLGVEPLGFAAALEAEEARIDEQWSRMLRGQAYQGMQIYHYSYKRTGHYDEQIDALFEVFDPPQVLIMKSEDLFADPVATVARVVRFLELPSFTLSDSRTYNKGNGNRHPIGTDVKRQLAAYFEPHNQRLKDFRPDLSW